MVMVIIKAPLNLKCVGLENKKSKSPISLTVSIKEKSELISG